jgi:hypothetical protein
MIGLAEFHNLREVVSRLSRPSFAIFLNSQQMLAAAKTGIVDALGPGIG